MKVAEYYIQTIDVVTENEFFELINKNRKHLTRGFPVTVSLCESLDGAKRYFDQKKTNQKELKEHYFYITSSETDMLIGYACVKNIDLKLKKAELAYFIDKDFQSMGITSKIIAEVIDFCFNQLSLHKLFICTAKDNHPSRQVALKNGFIQEGILRDEHITIDGTLEDVVYFGLIKQSSPTEG